MRKNGLSLVIILVAVLLLSGCATFLPYGQLYTNVKAPVAATGDVSYSKVGTATATSILGIVATGDASIDAAARDGGITEIKYVDYEVNNILGIYGQYTTTVYGD
ncbi:MAG: TRL-like protein family [Candidatus Omnitrophica bacterium]|nr:TRL-like protein family [Candidatus Omnitrophota bacterium]